MPKTAAVAAPKPDTSGLADGILRWTLLALAALLPIFVLPWTTEVVEFNKRALLMAGAGILTVTWLAKTVGEKKLSYQRSWTNIIVVLVVAASVASTVLSTSPYASLVGQPGQEYSSLLSVLAYAAIYWVAVNTLRTDAARRELLCAVIVGGAITAAFAIGHGVGLVTLPFFPAGAIGPAFTLTGTVTSMGFVLGVTAMLSLGLLIVPAVPVATDAMPDARRSSRITKWLGSLALLAVLCASLVVLGAVRFAPLSAAVVCGAIVLAALGVARRRAGDGMLGVAAAILTVTFGLLVLLTNVPASFLSYPSEVRITNDVATIVAKAALGERVLVGSGPGTFAYAYLRHRPESVSASPLWDVPFDVATSQFVTDLVTMGVIGTVCMLLLMIVAAWAALRRFVTRDDAARRDFAPPFAALLVLTVAYFSYGYSMTVAFDFWLMLAIFTATQAGRWTVLPFDRALILGRLSAIGFVLAAVLGLAGTVMGSQRYAAAMNHATALSMHAQGADADDIAGEFRLAAQRSSWNDEYQRDYALAQLVQTRALLDQSADLTKEPGETDDAFAARQKGAVDERLRQATAITAAAITSGSRATQLGPTNVKNWIVLGSMYQSLLGITDGADSWAVTSFEKAITLDPTNPVLRTEIGKVYAYQAEVQHQASLRKELSPEQSAAIANKGDALLASAIASYEKAIALKSDYAPAHFQLGMALDKQGRLPEAITRLEKAVQLDPSDTGVGYELALMYHRAKRTDDAIALLESIVAAAPDFSNGMWYLASMYEEKGDKARAIALLKRVLALNPKNELVQQKLQSLGVK